MRGLARCLGGPGQAASRDVQGPECTATVSSERSYAPFVRTLGDHCDRRDRHGGPCSRSTSALGTSGSSADYSQTIRRASLALTNIDTVVTGHSGSLSTMADLRRYGEFVREWVDAIRDAKNDGLSPDEFMGGGGCPSVIFKKDIYRFRRSSMQSGMTYLRCTGERHRPTSSLRVSGLGPAIT